MSVWKGRLPHGVTDRFGMEAARHTALRRVFRSVFLAWGYQEVIPPTFEYAGTQSTQIGPRLLEEMYRFVDRDGHTLALRADLTVATARIVGTRLVDQPLPLRLCYVGHVFRHEEPRAGRQREFTQAGVELIGSGRVEADAEVIAVAVAALQAAGLTQYQINIGHSDWLRSLVNGQDVPAETVSQLALALGRKDRAMLADLLAGGHLSAASAAAIRATPHLNGGREALDRADALAAATPATAPIRRLRELADLLARRGLSDAVAFDLAETKGMDYYTGITFEGFVPGIGAPVCSGGRYDDLLAQFGRALPAVGVAVELERLLLALPDTALPGVQIAPDVACAYPHSAAAAALVAAARRAGWRIDEDVDGRREDDLLAWAAARGAGQVWLWEAGDAVRVVVNDAAARVSLSALAERVAAGRPVEQERVR